MENGTHSTHYHELIKRTTLRIYCEAGSIIEARAQANKMYCMEKDVSPNDATEYFWSQVQFVLNDLEKTFK